MDGVWRGVDGIWRGFGLCVHTCGWYLCEYYFFCNQKGLVLYYTRTIVKNLLQIKKYGLSHFTGHLANKKRMFHHFSGKKENTVVKLKIEAAS